MAKTTVDYFNDGVAMFAENKARPVGTSWQAKAMQGGWDETEKIAKQHEASDKASINAIDGGFVGEKLIVDTTKIDPTYKGPVRITFGSSDIIEAEKFLDDIRGYNDRCIKRKNTLLAVKQHIKHLEMLADAEHLGSAKFHRYVNKIEKLEAKYDLV